MADRIVLHIGTMKSGTTYIQSRLARAIGPERGYDFVGGFPAQAAAVRQLLSRPRSAQAVAAWQAIAGKARAFEGELAIISMEFLSFAKPEAVDVLLSGLDGLEVQVVIVARDQHGAIPAQWQTFARQRGTDPWATYLRRIDPVRMRSGDELTHAYRSFHRAQDVDVVVERWAGHPRVHSFDAITMPATRSAGQESFDLWTAFADVVGIGSGLPEPAGLAANESLGHASCEVLRRLNVHLVGAHPREVKRRGMRQLIADALAPRQHLDARPALDRAGAAFARHRNLVFRAALSDERVRLHGSLDHLSLEELPAPRRAPGPPRSEVRACAGALWQRCADEVGQTRRMPARVDARIAEVAKMAPFTEAWRRAAGLSSRARPASP